MSEFRTRSEYLAEQLGTIDDEIGLTDYGLLNHGRGAHIVEPKDTADKTIPSIRKQIRHAGGKAPVYEDGGLTITNTWDRDGELVMRVEIDPGYEELFNLIDRLHALPYLGEEDVFLREPPERGLTTCEVVITYDRTRDARRTEQHGVLNQEMWSLLDNFNVTRLDLDTDVVTIVCQPRSDRFTP